MSARGVLIAGGGLAAQRCCERLRALGHDGPLTLVCGEPRPPYDRPPLSKDVLAGARGAEELSLREPDWYASAGVELVLGDPARALHPGERVLELASGERLPYERLVIATGARARALPAAEPFENARTLRSADDAESLRAALAPGVRLAIVGAGFIGQEVAASARALGCEVTLVEATAVPLAAVLPGELGAWLAGMHAEEGVDVRLGAGVAGLHGASGRVEEIELATGERIGCDELVVGIGVVPASDWLEPAGLGPGPVATDAAGRTALAGVFAAGDVTGGDHWEAAAWQGGAVAKAILGHEPGDAPLPVFWSDQYGTRIQCVGNPRGADAIELDGDLRARDFSALMLRRGRPVAALLAGRPRELPALRRRIQQPQTTTPAQEAA